jgi:hypothetical protein
MSDENTNTQKLKYEGLAALIMTRFDTMQSYNKEQFDRFHKHNEKQNESIAKAIGRIEAIEKRELTKYNDCPLVKKVDELEKFDLTHVATCPVEPRVKSLEDKNLGKTSVKRFLMTAITVMGSVLGSTWVAYKLFVEPILSNLPQ